MRTDHPHGSICEWNVEGRVLERTLPYDFSVQYLARSRDGRFLARANHTRGEVGIHDMLHPDNDFTISCGHRIWDVVLSPNGKTLACTSGPKVVEYWDLDQKDLRFELVAHDDAIRTVSFSPDGKVLATASNDDTAKLWRAATDEEVELMRRRWLAMGKEAADRTADRN